MSLPPVPRRRRVGHHLAHRVPVQVERPVGFPDAHPLHHHRSQDPQVYFHLEHPSHHPLVQLRTYGWRRAVRFSTAECQPVDPPTWDALAPPLTSLTAAFRRGLPPLTAPSHSPPLPRSPPVPPLLLWRPPLWGRSGCCDPGPVASFSVRR